MAKSFGAQDLVKSFRQRRVVDGVSLNVERGEIVGLLGPNGAGKTTTFYMMVGLLAPQAGSVYLDGVDISGMAMYKRARKGIGYLSQESSVFRRLTVEQNIRAILEFMEMDETERNTRCDRVLKELGIGHLRDSEAYLLSGGERRRVEIARALVNEPAFLLLDEPFSGIDPIAVGDIQDIVVGLKTKDIGILITDHNVAATLGICDRAYIIDKGRILMRGAPEEILKSREVREAYLGERFRM